MRKCDVQTHNDRPYGNQYPAICVKVRSFVSSSAVVARFKCDHACAEKALEYAFSFAQSRFWVTAQEFADDTWGKGTTKVYGTGRSAGWLIVTDIGTPDEWDAIALGKWAHFECLIRGEIAALCETSTVLDDIDANEWHKPGAEEYNFIDTKTGPKCLADLKASAIAAGYGPVVRA